MTSPHGPQHSGPASTGPGPVPTGRAGEPGADPTAVGPPRFDPAGPVAAPVARHADALAEPVAAAVLACPHVAGLSGGPFGTVGTYLPGRRVTGVQITDTDVTVRIIARLAPLRTLEAEVRAAVAAVLPGVPVHLGVDDLTTDETAMGPATTGAAPGPTATRSPGDTARSA